MLRVSSKRINMIDRARPRPAVKSAKAIPTISTSGRVNARGCPEMKQTKASGNIPMKKLVNPANAEEIAKICGGT